MIAYHVSKASPELILKKGLNRKGAGKYLAQGNFNLPGNYVYTCLSATRRLYSRSTVYLYEVDITGLKTADDAWGGAGALRVKEVIAPERIRHVHTYLPFEKPVAPENFNYGKVDPKIQAKLPGRYQNA